MFEGRQFAIFGEEYIPHITNHIFSPNRSLKDYSLKMIACAPYNGINKINICNSKFWFILWLTHCYFQGDVRTAFDTCRFGCHIWKFCLCHGPWWNFCTLWWIVLALSPALVKVAVCLSPSLALNMRPQRWTERLSHMSVFYHRKDSN